MRIREAWSRIVVAPVIGGLIIGSVLLGSCAPKSVEAPAPTDNMCRMFLLKSSDCEEDTMGWIGSAEDDRFKAVKA